LFTGGPDAEHAAGILGGLLAGENVVRELTVTAYHVHIVPHRVAPAGRRLTPAPPRPRVAPTPGRSYASEVPCTIGGNLYPPSDPARYLRSLRRQSLRCLCLHSPPARGSHDR